MHKILIYLHVKHLLKSSTCFEHYPAHLQEVYVVIVYMQSLVSSLSVHRMFQRRYLRSKIPSLSIDQPNDLRLQRPATVTPHIPLSQPHSIDVPDLFFVRNSASVKCVLLRTTRSDLTAIRITKHNAHISRLHKCIFAPYIHQTTTPVFAQGHYHISPQTNVLRN
jgi:hypothetical protein